MKITRFIVYLGLLALIAGSLFFKEDKESLESLPQVQERSSFQKKLHQKVNGVKSDVLSKVLEHKGDKKQAFEFLMDQEKETPLYLKETDLSIPEAKGYLKKSLSSLMDCLEEGCGQGPDADGMYDPANTAAVYSTERIIKIALENQSELDAKEWLTPEKLQELLSSPSHRLRKLSRQALIKIHGPDVGFQKILEKTSELEGYSTGENFKALAPLVTESNRKNYFDALEQVTKEKDAFTVSESLENSEEFKVTDTEIKQLGDNLCRFKKKKSTLSTFKAMNYSTKIMAQNSQFNFNLNSYCP